jgi:hypothetical protein
MTTSRRRQTKKAVGSDAHGLDSYEFCLQGNRRTPIRQNTIATSAGANAEEHGGEDVLIHWVRFTFLKIYNVIILP